jgi:hypothetical protein
VRPTLYLFGRAAAGRDLDDTGVWKSELLPDGDVRPYVEPGEFERRFALAAVTDLHDETSSGKAKRSIALNREHLAGPFKQLERDVPPADQESHAAMVSWLYDGDPGPLIRLAGETGPPLNLAFAGLVATGATTELERSGRRS